MSLMSLIYFGCQVWVLWEIEYDDEVQVEVEFLSSWVLEFLSFECVEYIECRDLSIFECWVLNILSV